MKVKAERDDSGNYGYGNYVYVQFADGEPAKYSTYNLEKANSDQPLTSGRRTVRNFQLTVERSLANGDTVDFDRGMVLSKQTGEPIPNVEFDPDFIDFNEIDYSKYGNQIIGGPTATKAVKAGDLKAGDTLWDANGGRMGENYSIRRGTAKNGTKVVEVTFNDNPDDNLKTKQKFTSDSTVLSSSKPGPKQMAPLTPLGESARELGIGVDPSTGSSANQLSIHKSEDLDETNTTPVKDSKSLRAVKPTDETREAKNKVTQIGSEIRSRVDEKTLEILRSRENLNLASSADLNNVYSEVVKASDETKKAAVDAKNALNDLHAAETKKFSTAASRKAVMSNMATDGYILPNGLVDKDKLSKELAGKRLGSIAALVDRATDKNDALFAYAYTALKNPAVNAKVKTAQKSREAADRVYTDAANKRSRMSAVVGKAARDAYKEVMAEEGVELDNVSLDEFNGHLYSLEKKLKIRSTDTFKSKKALEEFFEVVPSSVIRGLLANLKSEKKKLYIEALGNKARAYMTDEPDGYAVHLSNGLNPYDDSDSATDSAVHEVTHVLEHVFDNIRALQHAWLYDRSAMFPGTENETLPNFMYLPEQGLGRGERALATPGLALGYMAKQYPEDKTHILNPNDGHFEVSTVLMQELASAHGVASRGRGLSVVTTEFNLDGSRKSYNNVHFDPKTAQYYTDATMSTPIDNVIAAFGRDSKDGIDNDARDFIYGMIYSLSDRQGPPGPLGSAGKPGGSSEVSVPKPSASVQSVLKKESAKPDAGFLASVLSKVGGGTNLTREEYSELVDYLSQLDVESGYGSAEVTKVKNYLRKILGL